MYGIRHLNCSTSSVLSGIKSFSKRRTARTGGWRSKSSDRSVTFTSHYIRILMLPQQDSPPPLAIGTGCCFTQPRIQCATSLAIFTTTLPPQPLFVLSYTITLRCPLLPLPVPMRLPRPYLPYFMSSKASRMCHGLTASTLPIRQPSKASAFLLPHKIEPPLVQYGTLSTQV